MVVRKDRIESTFTYIISLAEGDREKGQSAARPLLFDIDVIKEIFPEYSKPLSLPATYLHDRVWDIFSKSISEHYDAVLKKEIN